MIVGMGDTEGIKGKGQTAEQRAKPHQEQSRRAGERDGQTCRSHADQRSHYNAASVESVGQAPQRPLQRNAAENDHAHEQGRSEEHTSELQSLMRISYAVFCLKKKREYTRNSPQNDTPQIESPTRQSSPRTVQRTHNNRL